MSLRCFTPRLLVCVALLCVPTMAIGQSTPSVLFGFTAFPYDLTPEAIEQVHQIILPQSNLYALHFDRCLPWREALENKPFPKWLQDDWQSIKRYIPETHTVYVAVTPSAIDRRSLAPACSSRDEEEEPVPFKSASFTHPDVMQAYLNYVKRVVDFFQPRYLNIGIEMSELSLRYPKEWPPFAALFMYVYDALKSQYPSLQIGAEFVLQSLMLPRVANQVKPVVNKSDYVGLSFYPYGSNYGVRLGAPPLPAGADQWNAPLHWVRQYTTKPLALCETGYITQPLYLKQGNLRFAGSDNLQAAFARDVLQAAVRDRYAFVVWFIPVDYDRLFAKLPPGSEWKSIWMHAGFFDKDLRPKPAWSVWQNFAQDMRHSEAPRLRIELPQQVAQTATDKAPMRVGFMDTQDLFSCEAGRAALDATVQQGSGASMRWQFTYSGDWSWCQRPVPQGHLAGVERVRLWVKSDRDGAIALRLNEAGGEVFYAIVPVGQEWRQETRALIHFSHDGVSKGNGRLDPEQIVSIMVVDGGGAEDGARGERTLWFSDWVFE